jgi:CRISPR-associated endonuclease/helicase Cas3
MKALTLADFGSFFAAVRSGLEPFPWQMRLAERVLGPEGLGWPEAITLPTASGKTACLDIAVFALAAQAHLPPPSRKTLRRICFVVDRRVIVDEAYQQAQRLAQALREATPGGILHEVAQRLRVLADDAASRPLEVFELRGGIYRDQAWARTPTQPTIICSTVDQIGSRLLFRGYGVSGFAAPIQAGLVAHDTLILLDEAHCAEPFLETARAVDRYRARRTSPFPQPFRLVVMSATPPPDCKDCLSTQEDDRRHPILGARLKASKPTKLVVAEQASGARFVEPLAKAMVAEAEALIGDGRMVIGIIVNRVAIAKAVYEALQAHHSERVLLMTGRMRPWDRDELVAGPFERFQLATPKAVERKFTQPVFVVATQCLEVGADIDFDGLVSECAPLDALRQRFGRLNRGGRALAAQGVVVVRKDQTQPSEEEGEADPVYGNALARTWQWLFAHCQSNEIDLGVQALAQRLERLATEERDGLRSAPVHSPVMLPAHLDCWVQTSPAPVPSPDPAVFLHGPQRGEPEVQVCWRADLPVPTQENLASTQTMWTDVLALCPPAGAECLRVPLWLFRRWLANRGQPPSNDLSDAGEHFSQDEQSPSSVHPVLRWRGPEDSGFITKPDDLAPGDVLVLSVEEGGWETFGHVQSDPDRIAAVDIGDAVQLSARAQPVLRLHPALLRIWPDVPAKSELIDLLVQPDLEEAVLAAEFAQQLGELLARLSVQIAPLAVQWLADSAALLANELRSKARARRCLYLHPASPGALIVRALRRVNLSNVGDTFADEDYSSSITKPVILDRHSNDVACLAERFALACGLSPDLVADLKLAGMLHDGGKADLRFQSLLRGGLSPALVQSLPILAKSDTLSLARKPYGESRKLAHYPEGGRHELISVRLAESASLLLAQAHDCDLVLHLIASSHGRCRPLAPVIADPDAPATAWIANGAEMCWSGPTGLERLDSGVADRFWRLTRRYGWWGLADLEAILRLADHRVSEKT